MKKIINYSLGLVLSALLFTACTDYLDINRDPSYPAQASTPLLFASGTTWSASILGCDVQLVTALWSQQYAQNTNSQQYATIDQYNMTNSNSYFSRYWQSIYAGALPDLKQVISQSEKEGSWNYWLAAKVMTAYDFNMLVSLFEKVPFSPKQRL
ncbi:MAG: SusD/RagB family nutrient-binding outer membrane lipoprotein, partial [Bacteroidota bacterium]|nr:SusD/RagB family nutrient-binding outer membrane lipoprotein [Bacteroidota bacterium]